MRALGPILGHYRGRMLAAITLSVVGQVIAAQLPLVQKVILDDAVVHHRRPLSPGCSSWSPWGALRSCSTTAATASGAGASTSSTICGSPFTATCSTCSTQPATIGFASAT